MNNRPPVVILFKPALELAPHIQLPMNQLPVAFAVCNSTEDLSECLRLYHTNTPVICMPFVLDGGRSGINETLQIRSLEAFKDLKIIGFLTLHDKISMHSFFSAGADIVMQAPLDSDLITLQVHALAKSYEEQREIAGRAKRDQEITSSTMRFLDTTRDGVVIVDDNAKLIIANRAAERILALDEENYHESFKKIAPQLIPLLEQHIQRETEENSLGELLSSVDMTVRKSDGRTSPLLLRIITLIGSEGARVGFAIGIGDLSIPRQIATKLVNQERLRTLSLTLASGALALLRTPSLGIPGSPLKLLEQKFADEPERILLSHVITPLLELVDIILPPQSEIRVSFKEDCEVMASRSDVFQLIGALLFFAVERTGPGGETFVDTKLSTDGEQVSLIFSYSANELVEPITGDYFMALVHGDHGRFLFKDDTSIHTLKFAQQIAERLGVPIEAKSRSRWEGKIRIMLPCIPLEKP